MRYRLVSATLAALALAAGTALPARAQPAGIERFGLYVVAEDLDRASLFYERLFASKPQVRTAALVGFDVAGGLYAIVSRQAYAPAAIRGGNVVPYIKVRDIFAEFERVKRLAPASLQSGRVVDEGAFKFFRFADPDGNVIEFFSIEPPA
ncbi:MAG TPA: VOC family protein [Allosphingosinicella sp.]|nr:VOC family protein [Allosphingosinicella sp.]